MFKVHAAIQLEDFSFPFGLPESWQFPLFDQQMPLRTTNMGRFGSPEDQIGSSFCNIFVLHCLGPVLADGQKGASAL